LKKYKDPPFVAELKSSCVDDENIFDDCRYIAPPEVKALLFAKLLNSTNVVQLFKMYNPPPELALLSTKDTETSLERTNLRL